MKVSDRLTINAGLRYEVYVPDTEERTACRTSTPGMRLVYAGEDGPTAAPTRRRAGATSRPRLGLAWDVTGDAQERPARRLRHELLPGAPRGRNLIGPERALSISQNYSAETNPLDFSPDRVPRLSNPFPPIVPVKPQTTAELNAANPLVFGHAFANETPHMHTWQVSYERQLTNTLMAEVAYAGSKGTTSSGSATSTRSSRARARRPRAG